MTGNNEKVVGVGGEERSGEGMGCGKD